MMANPEEHYAVVRKLRADGIQKMNQTSSWSLKPRLGALRF